LFRLPDAILTVSVATGHKCEIKVKQKWAKVAIQGDDESRKYLYKKAKEKMKKKYRGEFQTFMNYENTTFSIKCWLEEKAPSPKKGEQLSFKF
jgi:hypothetical protein